MSNFDRVNQKIKGGRFGTQCSIYHYFSFCPGSRLNWLTAHVNLLYGALTYTSDATCTFILCHVIVKQLVVGRLIFFYSALVETIDRLLRNLGWDI